MIDRLFLLLLMKGYGMMSKSMIRCQLIEIQRLGTLAIDCCKLMLMAQVPYLIKVFVYRFGLTPHPNNFIFYNRESQYNKTVQFIKSYLRVIQVEEVLVAQKSLVEMQNGYLIYIVAIMGNSQPKAVTKVEGEEVPKINHERFANRQIIKNGSEEENILIKVAVPHQKEYTVWSEQLDKVGKPEALLLPKSHSFKKEGFCGLSGIVDIVYQNYPFLLSDEIHNRECLGTKFFEENELWYLVLTLLSAGEFFHSQNKKIGDVRPENVFISEDGSVKVACLYSWPMERTNYQKSFQKSITYLAPEEVVEMGYGKTEPSAAFDLSETFSIGLTLLDAATLSDSRDLYKGQKSFDYQTLQQRLKQLQGKEQYSRLLKALIHNMCDVTPENRSNCRELFDWLSPFQQQINNFEEFQTAQLPQKLKVTYSRVSGQYYSQPAAPLNSSNNYNTFNTYVQSNQAPYQSVPITNSPPRPYTFTHGDYPQPQQIKVDYTSQAPQRYTSSGSGVNTNNFNPGPIGFTFQSSTSPGTYVGSTSSVPVTSQPVNFVSGGSQPQGYSGGVVESTYVPYSSKFSLQKIDEQLQQSRKMFPS